MKPSRENAVDPRAARNGEFKERVILITGGANGIGAAMVRAFHRESGNVFFCDIDGGEGEKLARECGEGVEFARVDLMREAEIRRWIQVIGKRFGRIDVLINNAAADPRIPLEKTSVKDWDTLFARNLRAYFLTCREAAPFLKEGSAIINFSSANFHMGPVDLTAYVATKAGIQGFTRSLARELGKRRIRVNTLTPGWVMTERQLRQYVTSGAKRLIKQSQCIPDLLQPEEIAPVALFLAGEQSRAITGQEILVDRGWNHS